MNAIIGDSVSEFDYLEYKPYIEAFKHLIVSDLLQLPITLGIHGEWGIGKSTFMNILSKSLDGNEDLLTLDINMWEYPENVNFESVFLLKLHQLLNNNSSFIKRFGSDILDMLNMEVKNITLKFSIIEGQIVNKNSELISHDIFRKEKMQKILSKFKEKQVKIVTFIDDLDRCSLDKIMNLIESIKIVLNGENCIFVLGCDNKYLESAINIKFRDYIDIMGNENSKELFAKRYIEKIIQVSFSIPKISKENKENFVDEIIGKKQNPKYEEVEYKVEKTELHFEGDFIKKFVHSMNPRQIRRFINNIYLNYLIMLFKLENEGSSYEMNNKPDLDFIVFLEYAKNNKNLVEILFESSLNEVEVFIKKQYQYFINDDNSDEKEICEELNILFSRYKVKEEGIDSIIKYLDKYIMTANIINENSDVRINTDEKINHLNCTGFYENLSSDKDKEFMRWFINKFYMYFQEQKLSLGISKNIHIYLGKLNNPNEFLLRFVNKNGFLEIILKTKMGYKAYESLIIYEFKNNEDRHNTYKENTNLKILRPDKVNELKKINEKIDSEKYSILVNELEENKIDDLKFFIEREICDLVTKLSISKVVNM